jgi:mono/diheme cytochrome c family protein
MKRLSRFWVRGALAVATLGLAVQLVPYGRDHRAPSTTVEPPWDSAATRALAKRACFDCHSNETRWPIYASIAPVSWLVQYDVDAGRDALNFSEWLRPQREAREAAEKVREGEMPLALYELMHADARLTTAERAALAQGLSRTIGGPRQKGGDR